MAKFIDLDTGLSALLNKVKTWVNTKLTAKQDALVSGTNIKTVNNESLLGGGNITISSGTSPHIGANGNWWIGPETDSNNDTGVKAQGNDGNVTVTDGSATIVIGNMLNGQGDVLGMSGAMQVRSNIDILAASLNRLYAKLANLAFWSAQDKTEAAPTALDWSTPKHTVTLSLNLTHAVVKYNGVVKNNGDTIPNIEEGSTIQLTVEAESGYELDSISSQAGIVNGSIVSLVMGMSNATLDITASASSAYPISYALTNCAAPTGVTNPTTIKSGETKTIYLEADNNFTMPASLPAGAVTGATAAYTRDSQDDTLASIVLSNATGNVTVDIDGVEIPPELHLVLQAFIDTGNSHYFIQGGSYNSNAKKRAMVVVKRAETSRPCTWGSGDGSSEDAALEAEYSAIPIPSGATQVTMKCNSTYYYLVGLLNSSGVAQNADNKWTVGSTQKSWTLADYPNATHIQLIFKIGSGGTTQFSNQTWETIGIDFNIE